MIHFLKESGTSEVLFLRQKPENVFVIGNDFIILLTAVKYRKKRCENNEKRSLMSVIRRYLPSDHNGMPGLGGTLYLQQRGFGHCFFLGTGKCVQTGLNTEG